jgi:hypothetical protein
VRHTTFVDESACLTADDVWNGKVIVQEGIVGIATGYMLDD